MLVEKGDTQKTQKSLYFRKLKVKEDEILVSFDVTLYTNLPIKETLVIIKTLIMQINIVPYDNLKKYKTKAKPNNLILSKSSRQMEHLAIVWYNHVYAKSVVTLEKIRLYVSKFCIIQTK